MDVSPRRHSWDDVEELTMSGIDDFAVSARSHKHSGAINNYHNDNDDDDDDDDYGDYGSDTDTRMTQGTGSEVSTVYRLQQWQEMVDDELDRLEDLFDDYNEGSLLQQSRLRNSLKSEHPVMMTKRGLLTAELDNTKSEQAMLNVSIMLVQFQAERPSADGPKAQVERTYKNDLCFVRTVHRFLARHKADGQHGPIPVSSVEDIFQKVATHRPCPPRLVMVPEDDWTAISASDATPTNQNQHKRRRRLPFDLNTVRSEKTDETMLLAQDLYELADTRRQERCKVLLQQPAEKNMIDCDRAEMLKEETKKFECVADIMAVWSFFLQKEVFQSRTIDWYEEQTMLVQDMIELVSEGSFNDKDVDSLLCGLLQFIGMSNKTKTRMGEEQHSHDM